MKTLSNRVKDVGTGGASMPKRKRAVRGMYDDVPNQGRTQFRPLPAHSRQSLLPLKLAPRSLSSLDAALFG